MNFPLGRRPFRMANALVMPYVIAFNSTVCLDRYADIARAAGIEGKDDGTLVARFLEVLQNMRKDIGIPMSICAAAEQRNVLDSYHEETLIDNAMLDGCAQTNPRPYTAQDVKNLYQAAFHGTVPLLS